ncbi:Os07g0136866 [Oryza sativa Japonica Group]|uniref:Os07g0136866 protein n=1 Tax=Oryza sativa subsp. japonica TaxID=39947 RepID=A0A0P0X2D1_ORYSJ|nr:hypothetical protein EE612_037009 [Oryza sativa]BAS99974.1 Os07g0136866 [Oryza sativa Japonica Group]
MGCSISVYNEVAMKQKTGSPSVGVEGTAKKRMRGSLSLPFDLGDEDVNLVTLRVIQRDEDANLMTLRVIQRLFSH